MKLQFLGANRQVTGSCHLLQAAGRAVMVDCGMFQESRFRDRNDDPFPLPPGELDAVLLTHAHLDHVGRLPLLVRDGFRGPIYTHYASADLAAIVLEDAAKIQRHDSEEYGEAPLYTSEDVERTLSLIEPHGYGVPMGIGDDIGVVMHDAGHILGSASLEVVVREHRSEPRTVVFSGDIGQGGKPLIRDPAPPPRADVLVVESTYGDRDHEHATDITDALQRIIESTHARGGRLLVPTFAVERAQELLYHLNDLREAKRISRVPVYLDSPMAVKVTKLFDHHLELLDAEALARLRAGDDPLDFPELYELTTTGQSIAADRSDGGGIVLAGSGMCTAGRILHHLKHGLGDERNTVLFVGHQATGTLGRDILSGAPRVTIDGRSVAVRARVEQLQGMSAHADRTGLLRWMTAMAGPPSHIFLTHGERDAAASLAGDIEQRLPQTHVAVPNYRETAEL